METFLQQFFFLKLDDKLFYKMKVSSLKLIIYWVNLNIDKNQHNFLVIFSLFFQFFQQLFLQGLKGYLHRYYSSLFHTYHSFYGQICMYVAFSARMCIFTVKLVFKYLVFYFCSHLDYIYIISIDISGMFYQCEQILVFL